MLAGAALDDVQAFGSRSRRLGPDTPGLGQAENAPFRLLKSCGRALMGFCAATGAAGAIATSAGTVGGASGSGAGGSGAGSSASSNSRRTAPSGLVLQRHLAFSDPTFEQAYRLHIAPPSSKELAMAAMHLAGSVASAARVGAAGGLAMAASVTICCVLPASAQLALLLRSPRAVRRHKQAALALMWASQDAWMAVNLPVVLTTFLAHSRLSLQGRAWMVVVSAASRVGA